MRALGVAARSAVNAESEFATRRCLESRPECSRELSAEWLTVAGGEAPCDRRAMNSGELELNGAPDQNAALEIELSFEFFSPEADEQAGAVSVEGP